jgi:hypothetical protein
VPSGRTTFHLVDAGLMAYALRQSSGHDVAEVSGVMRPRLPSIRSDDPITEASASDRGWIREPSRICNHTLLLELLARYRHEQH